MHRRSAEWCRSVRSRHRPPALLSAGRDVPQLSHPRCRMVARPVLIRSGSSHVAACQPSRKSSATGRRTASLHHSGRPTSSPKICDPNCARNTGRRNPTASGLPSQLAWRTPATDPGAVVPTTSLVAQLSSRQLDEHLRDLADVRTITTDAANLQLAPPGSSIDRYRHDPPPRPQPKMSSLFTGTEPLLCPCRLLA